MTSQETVQKLTDMGFQKEKAEKSVSVTENQGVGPVMEWLSAHDDKMGLSTTEEGSTSNTNSETGTSSETVAKSNKYEDCNKLFADTTPLKYHAMKSGHSDFADLKEEKKLLTEDEKKEQIKILEKREECEAKEKGEELEREKMRIRSGEEMAVDNKKLEDENMKEIMDERKREKQEEKVTHTQMIVQIEADKSIRGNLYAQISAEDRLKYILPVAIKTVSARKQKKNYTETKLQIRLTNGQTIVQTFNVKEMMDAVKVYIELNRSDGDAPFCLMTRFPRKVFTRDDYNKSLDELGLVPSAVLILTKPQE